MEDLEGNIDETASISANSTDGRIPDDKSTRIEASETTGRSEIIFLISGMISLVADPFFLYIPVIDEGKKCLRMDAKLRTASLVLRSLGDLTFVMHAVYQIRKAIKTVNFNSEPAAGGSSRLYNFHNHWRKHGRVIYKKLPKLSILCDFLAVLPLPQVFILVFLVKIRESGFLDRRISQGNLYLVLQYLFKVYRIQILSTTVARTWGFIVKIWFYLFLYIIGAHVFGAFWYFFGVQREMECWHQASIKSTFYCDDISSRNTTLLNELCPINSPDPTLFDFGIFLESLQSNNRGSTDLIQKVFFSIWWGMRNLSSFGQNLATSNFYWENAFAIYMSIILPLLFFVIGKNVQTFFANKELLLKPKWKTKLKLSLTEWISGYNFPPDLRQEIDQIASGKFKENMEIDVKTVLSLLPSHTRKSLRRFLCMSTLSNVPRLVGMDVRALKMMCDYLEPVVYMVDSYVVRSGDPLNFILLVVIEGKLSVTGDASSTSIRYIEKDDFYGHEQLLGSATPGNDSSSSFSSTSLHISKENVKCNSKVEGFLLRATALEFVLSKCKNLWQHNNNGDEMVLRSKIE